MDTYEIGLYVEGTPTNANEVMPLVTIGRFPTKGLLAEKDELIHEPISYSICYQSDYKCFSLIDRSVRPFGSQRKGRLSVNIAIPKQSQFANGQSPYTLLKEIYNLFLALCMYEAPGGAHIFNEGSAEREVFEKLLKKYRLEKECCGSISMKAGGPTAVVGISDTGKIAELMKDSDYSEFQEYGRVEIGSQVASTICIEIPRKERYQVVLNGVLNNRMLSDPKDVFDSSAWLKDTPFLSYKEHIRFTLEELLAANDGVLFDGRVKLSGHKILCTVQPKDKVVKFSTEIQGENAASVKAMLSAGVVKVLFAGEDIGKLFINGDSKTFKLKDIADPPKLIEDNGYSFRLEKNDDRLILHVRKRLSLPPSPPIHPVPRKMFSKKNIAIMAVVTLMVFLLGLLIGHIFFPKEYVTIKEVATGVDTIFISDPPVDTIFISDPPVTINDAQPVPDYKSQIVESVNNQNWKAVQELVVKAKTSGQISQKERDAIESLWWDKGGNRGKGGPITDAQRRKRDRALKGKQVSSIEDIVEIANEIYKW